MARLSTVAVGLATHGVSRFSFRHGAKQTDIILLAVRTKRRFFVFVLLK
jgi:hypothetical protein